MTEGVPWIVAAVFLLTADGHPKPHSPTLLQFSRSLHPLSCNLTRTFTLEEVMYLYNIKIYDIHVCAPDSFLSIMPLDYNNRHLSSLTVRETKHQEGEEVDGLRPPQCPLVCCSGFPAHSTSRAPCLAAHGVLPSSGHLSFRGKIPCARRLGLAICSDDAEDPGGK